MTQSLRVNVQMLPELVPCKGQKLVPFIGHVIVAVGTKLKGTAVALSVHVLANWPANLIQSVNDGL